MHARGMTLALVATGACLVTFAAAAGADAGKSPAMGMPAAAAAPGKTAAAPALDAAAGLLPRGYTIVTTAGLSAPNGTQTRGVATCPGAKVPLGGGAFVTSFSTRANINSSFPSGRSWVADINNASGAD